MLKHLRFIDDIFMIWTKLEKDLTEFLSELNTEHTSIKFEFKYSRQQIEFLDTLDSGITQYALINQFTRFTRLLNWRLNKKRYHCRDYCHCG